MSDDDECIHLNNPAYCTICNGKDAATKPVKRAALPVKKIAPRAAKAAGASTPSRGVTTSQASQVLDTPESVEVYRERYGADRQETFDAYVEVFFNTDARDFSGGWANFSRCANAEPERKETAAPLVAEAEALMRKAGYEADDSGRPLMGRRWHKTD